MFLNFLILVAMHLGSDFNIMMCSCLRIEQVRGVQVLHPAAMQPLQVLEEDILIRVRNSYNLVAPGSVIVKSRPQNDGGLITSIVLKEGGLPALLFMHALLSCA
jgi:hypothetical protein